MRSLALERVALVDLRNVQQAVLEPVPRFNVIAGNNGHGKTSILEAIYLLATTRSFRTSRVGEIIRHGTRTGNVRGRFVEQTASGHLRREQSVGLEGNRRVARLDGEPPATLAHFATRSPVVVFDPRQMTVSMGPSSERRTLLDRVSLFTEPDLGNHRNRYQQALRERQRLLADRPQLGRSPELDAYEELMAQHGAALTQARGRVVAALSVELGLAFDDIAAPDIVLQTRYEPAGSDDVAVCRERLRDGRRADARAKRTAFGPHRDDLALDIDGHPARVVGSQGQHRAITLALKIAELRCIASATRVSPILLLDDVSSELDAERTRALFAHLAGSRGQLFLTTTRRDLIITQDEDRDGRRDFLVEQGAVRVLPRG